VASKRESQLPTAAGFTSGDLITGLRAATNVNFSYSAVYDAVNGFGTIQQVGDPTGAPVLEQPVVGFNNIRNIESSKGMSAGISPQNGVMLTNNFTQPGLGAPIISDLNADQYEFRSILAGTDMAVSVTNGDIVISLAAGSSSIKTRVISSESDFPDPVGGVITLEDDIDYFLQNDIVTSHRFIVGGANTLRGPASQIVSLTYTGTGTMLTSTNPNFRADRVTLGCPNGTLFDISSSGGGIFQMIETTISSCQNIGTIGDMFLIRFKGLAYENVIAGGVVLTGVNDILVFDTSVMFLNGGTAYDFGTSLFNNLTITNQFVESDTVGTKFISGATGSANIAAGGLADVTNCRTDPATTPLTGVSTDDVRWEFLGNNTIPNTRPDALLSTTGNALQTTIGAIGVAVKANAVFVDDDTSQFATTSDGRTTYIGEKDASLPISLTATLLAAAGGDKQLSAYIAINGAIVPQTISTVTASSSKSNVAPSIWQPVFTNGDYVEIWVANDTNTDNVIVVNAVMRIN